MSAVGAMKMRATIQRNTASGLDGFRHPVKPDFQDYAVDVPCLVWSKQKTFIDTTEKIATIEFLRSMFPLDTDITQADQISAITDRQGVTVFPGRFAILTIQRRPRHLEAMLQQVGGGSGNG